MPTHEQGVASTALRSAPGIATARPVAVSPIQSSMPVGLVCANAKRTPSGEKPSQVSAGDGGSVTGRTAPSATAFNVSARAVRARCRPLVVGSMRSPASRSIGRARSAIVGMAACSSTATTSRDGLRHTSGGGGWSRMSTITLGGNR